MSLFDNKIAIIGLGYGLPLAVEFGKKYKTLGFDINEARITELCGGNDSTLECSSEELQEATKLSFSSNEEDLKASNVYIVTVPTPIDEHKQPDLTPLKNASEMLGRVVEKGDVVIYESTVYPGATEEDCIPVVEQVSGLKFNKDFFAGYSPERINPGDKEHRVTNILKVTSGSTPEISDFVDALYASIVTAGTHKASSIKVAEASKVIENTQRDVNIALVNELSIIFSKLGIDTTEVLEAAGTKWNFLPFRPGLVGGHCIGVDPYYLCHRAQKMGYIPDILIASRRINDGMAEFIVDEVVTLCIKNRVHINGAKALILGMAFKENCPDFRNTKVVDVIHGLESLGASVDVVDPWVSTEDVYQEYGVNVRNEIGDEKYDVVILAVAHKQFIGSSENLLDRVSHDETIIYDIKSGLDRSLISARL